MVDVDGGGGRYQHAERGCRGGCIGLRGGEGYQVVELFAGLFHSSYLLDAHSPLGGV